MRKYEIMVLVDSDIGKRQVPGLIEKHLEVIAADDGTVDNVDHWDRRHLAHDIDRKSEASYTVVQVTYDPALVQELDRLMGIDKRIVRTKVLRPEKWAFNTDAKSPALGTSVGRDGYSIDER